VGKTEFALRLARWLPVEIVNADSRQVYRYMDIGTAKPSPEERATVPHHVLDVVDPDEEFSLAQYLRLAREAAASTAERGALALVVGGTGQYVWSLMESWVVPEVAPDRDFRRDAGRRAAAEGGSALHAELARIDPAAAERIQATNVRRVIRALELYRATGTRPSELLWRKRGMPAGGLVLGLAMDRAALVARADARVDRMVKQGFADEVRLLLDRGYSPALPAMSSIGYRQMAQYVLGQVDLGTATAQVKQETRRLIRRQHAWFGPSDAHIVWLDGADPEAAALQAVRLMERSAR
jgi:tRNA dimethylallyltransferase